MLQRVTYEMTDDNNNDDSDGEQRTVRNVKFETMM